eukprot:gene14762-17442_t
MTVLSILPGCLPNGLKHITFGQDFNVDLDNVALPATLESLEFGMSWTRTIKPGSLPASLKRLVLGQGWDRPLVPGCLPKGLTHLSFGRYFSQHLLPRVLPNGLISLDISESYKCHPITPGCIPSSLAYLTINSVVNHRDISGVLTIVKHLTTNHINPPPILRYKTTLFSADPMDASRDAERLSIYLEHNFTVCIWFVSQDSNNSVSMVMKALDSSNILCIDPTEYINYHYGPQEHCITVDSVPSDLITPDKTHVTLADAFNTKMQPGCFPATVKEITLGQQYNKILEVGVVPEGVESFTFGYSWNGVVAPGSLPKSLKSLAFGHLYSQYIFPNALPSLLQRLVLGAHLYLRAPLPLSLEELEFSDDFNDELMYGTLPLRLKRLTLGHGYRQDIKQGVLPRTIIHLNLGYSYNWSIPAGKFTHLAVGSQYDHELSRETLPCLTNLCMLVYRSYRMKKSGTNIQ